jgi:hypothetical protein
VVIYNVLLPRLIVPLISGSLEERLLVIVPMMLGWLLLTKISPRLAVFGNIPVAYLVGVGAAVAIGGAVVGTLYPQVNATIAIFDLNASQGFDSNRGLQLVNGLIILVGTVTTLAYFQFGTGTQLPNPTGVRSLLDGLGQVGQVFIAIALGFLFAGVYSAAMVALVERLSFIVEFLKSVLIPLLTLRSWRQILNKTALLYWLSTWVRSTPGRYFLTLSKAAIASWHLDQRLPQRLPLTTI